MRKRKAEYHKKKVDKIVAAESVSPVTVYKWSSAKGRATAKVKTQLPTTPQRCREVVKSLAFEQMKIKLFSSKKKHRNKENEIQLENLVCDSYQ